MLVYLGFHLVGSDGVDLADLGSAGYALSKDHVKESELSVDGSLHDEVVLAAADHRHIDQHVFKAFLHPVDLGAAVEAVLTGALAYEFIFLRSQVIVFFRLEIVFLGDQLVLIKGFLLFVGTLVTLNLGAIFKHVLAYVQFLLFHLDLGVAEDVLLFCQFGFGVEYLQVQIVI